MEKVDFKKTLKHLYGGTKKPQIVEVPPMQFLSVEGKGAADASVAENPEFQNAIQALYGTAYTLKFMFKEMQKPKGYYEFVVPPLEGLWWMADGGEFDLDKPGDWRWKLMIMQPDFITPAMVEAAVAKAKKKEDLSPALDKLYYERYDEGTAVQILHVGPYDAEGPTIEKMNKYAEVQGVALHGLHHEIYLSDPRRTAPEKLKTVLRQPVRLKRD